MVRQELALRSWPWLTLASTAVMGWFLRIFEPFVKAAFLGERISRETRGFIEGLKFWLAMMVLWMLTELIWTFGRRAERRGRLLDAVEWLIRAGALMFAALEFYRWARPEFRTELGQGLFMAAGAYVWVVSIARASVAQIEAKPSAPPEARAAARPELGKSAWERGPKGRPIASTWDGVSKADLSSL